jgi:hypothetical protein
MRSNDELRVRRRCWREACKRWLALVVLLLPGIVWFPADAATAETRALAATAPVTAGAPAGGRAGHAAPRAIAPPQCRNASVRLRQLGLLDEAAEKQRVGEQGFGAAPVAAEQVIVRHAHHQARAVA